MTFAFASLVNQSARAGVDQFMANLDTFPGLDECIFCYGKVRAATREEVEARLRTASPEYRAAVEQQDGTWYVCTRCGPGSATKWQSIALE